jgi:hypothetical protein
MCCELSTQVKSNREMGVAALVEGCLRAATQTVVSLLGTCEGLCYYATTGWCLFVRIAGLGSLLLWVLNFEGGL